MADWPPDWPYLPNRTGNCPWCSTWALFGGAADLESAGRKQVASFVARESDTDLRVAVLAVRCPRCFLPVVSLMRYNEYSTTPESVKLVYPRHAARKPIPQGVPEHVAADYREAALVLADSPKASAALSRRCLQTVLREEGKTNSRDLADQIEEVLPSLPTYVAEDLDAVRNVGNFAAHLTKSKSTGEIVPVEPGEAEWNLDVLDLLFDHYYVQPVLAAERRKALDAKLGDAGKPPMKQPPSSAGSANSAT